MSKYIFGSHQLSSLKFSTQAHHGWTFTFSFSKTGFVKAVVSFQQLMTTDDNEIQHSRPWPKKHLACLSQAF